MLDLQEITSRVIREVGTETLQRAESMKPDEVEESGSLEFFDGGFVIKYNEEMTAFYEFRTGQFARSYLADKPQEVKDEAMKFYKNGKGDKFDYCVSHLCAYGMDTLSLEYLNDTIKELKCYNHADGGGDYCIEHTCKTEGCKWDVMAGEEYCSFCALNNALKQNRK